ncbi:hypothetical protein AM469_000669 [Pseudomonas aeruginosa]|nr:hypothetical protein AM469_000669 [Pseudomonas aeruginosa]
MWSKNKGRADVQRFTGQTSLIASGAELVGDMNLKGAVQIDGTVRGALQAHEGWCGSAPAVVSTAKSGPPM